MIYQQEGSPAESRHNFARAGQYYLQVIRQRTTAELNRTAAIPIKFEKAASLIVCFNETRLCAFPLDCWR